MKNAALVVSHNIRSNSAQQDFSTLVDRLDSRTPGVKVVGCYLDSDESQLYQQIDELCNQGVKGVLVIPYFLHNAGHATNDIATMVERFRSKFPVVDFCISTGLWNDTLVEDSLWEKIESFSTHADDLPKLGVDIENLSHSIIDRRISDMNFTPAQQAIVRRVIHATADFSFAQTIRIHPQAVEQGINALRCEAPIFCDVNMVKQGMTRLGCEVNCSMSEKEIADLAVTNNCTRAAALIDYYGTQLNGSILVVGNAPTMLWRLLERDDLQPALVVGMPVGFVGAREAKKALIDSGRVCIANTSPRGGSPAAAAAINALALLSKG